MIEAPTKVQCAATKANGDQCGAFAVRGKAKCAGHLGLGINKDPAAYQAKAAEARRETRQAKKLGFTDVLAMKLARDADQLAEQWIAEGKRDWRATEGALTRLFGKPKETVEVSGGLDLTAMSREERQALVQQALSDPDVLELLPAQFRLGA